VGVVSFLRDRDKAIRRKGELWVRRKEIDERGGKLGAFNYTPLEQAKLINNKKGRPETGAADGVGTEGDKSGHQGY